MLKFPINQKYIEKIQRATFASKSDFKPTEQS